MEAKHNSFYFCLLKKCLSVFSDKSLHSEHVKQLEKLPSELTEEYEFKTKLGTGANGVVFEVLDKIDKKQKAIKLINNQNDELEEVNAELAILSELHHTNIIRYFRPGFCDENKIFIVMEYCENNLEDFIEKNKPLAMETKNKLFKQLCSAMDYMHNENDLNVKFLF